jgi:dTDP-4-dehydrorhamnose reductase
LGAKSFLGKRFLKAYQALYPDTIGTHYQPSPGLLTFNLESPNLNSLPLEKGEYTYAVITSFISKVAICEKEKEKTYRLNVKNMLCLIEQLLEKEIIPIFFSSDYVFDGEKGNYEENSLLSPLNEYGKHKAEMERKIPLLCGKNHLILRLSKVFAVGKDENSFLNEIVSALMEGKKIKAAYDQIFCPILAHDVIQNVWLLQSQNTRGLFNLCGEMAMSRYDLALMVVKKTGVAETLLEKIRLQDLKEPFLRPCNTSMKIDKIRHLTGFCVSSMEDNIERIVTNYCKKI